MVKTRRSVNGDIDVRDYRKTALGSVADGKRVNNWTQRELRSRFRVTRKLTRWPARLTRIRMPRIVYPESDTDNEKYSRRRRSVRMFFGPTVVGGPTAVVANGTAVVHGRSNASGRRQLRSTNYMEDSGDKPIQQNVRRSGRQRKLLHHTFNESWITNELKVKGYPRLYGQLSHICSSPSDSSSDEDARRQPKRLKHSPPAHTDEETHSNGRVRRVSARSTKIKKDVESDSDTETPSQEVEEPKVTLTEESKKEDNPDEEDEVADEEKNEIDNNDETQEQNNDSKVGRMTTRHSGNCRMQLRPSRKTDSSTKKDNCHSQPESDMDASSDSGSDIVVRTRTPRRSNRTRKPSKAFLDESTCEPKPYKKKRFSLQGKTYGLRQRKPRNPRNIMVRSKNSSNSSSSSSDSEQEMWKEFNETKTKQKTKPLTETTDKALKSIQPVELDGSVRFSAVGGLEDHIKCLREMVLFPLMYPQLFEKFGTRPAKGVLFHGPPGTGKTLLARALANECSIQGGRKVSFFMRKGADCLRKWVGESERHLKLLFQQAFNMRPSIIFFDEIDALTPVRNARQDQVHTSVVGTLLAEMDGLCDRGEIVVIGATNRLDAVDPALRRAGRFDRELYFAAPATQARVAILDIYTSKWQPKPSEDAIKAVAEATVGYGGSDLKALCSEAVLKALRRTFPQVYMSEHALLIDPEKVEVKYEDMMNAMNCLISCNTRRALGSSPIRPLPSALMPLLGEQLQTLINRVREMLSASTNQNQPLQAPRLSCGTLLLQGGKGASGLLSSAVLAALEGVTVHEISGATLHRGLHLTPEQEILMTFSEAVRCARAARNDESVSGCAVLLPNLETAEAQLGGSGMSLVAQLWKQMGATLAASGTQLASSSRRLGNEGSAILISTCETDYGDLSDQVKDLFPLYKDCVYKIKPPSVADIINFLKPLFLIIPFENPPAKVNEVLPELPRAPTPPPRAPSPHTIEKRRRAEDYQLRELRIFLRDICRKLAGNRRFYKFTKPVDLNEVTDYLDIIKQPMDLETMMTKVDMHVYSCAQEFLADVDLIVANALEYNPDRTSSDKQIRHEACALRDHAYALIDVEMDSDFEMRCRDIARVRREAGANEANADLPQFIFTEKNRPLSQEPECTPKNGVPGTNLTNSAAANSSTNRRRRRKLSAWAKGFAKKPRTSGQKSSTPYSNKEESNQSMITDEESKENKPLSSSPAQNGDSESSAAVTPEKPSMSIDDDNSRTPHGMEDSGLMRGSNHNDTGPSFHLSIHDSSMGTSKRSSGFTHKSPRRRKESLTKDTEHKVALNKTEMESMLYRSAKQLQHVGFQALIDLHTDLGVLVNKYATVNDRSKLPSEMQAVVNRYLDFFAK